MRTPDRIGKTLAAIGLGLTLAACRVESTQNDQSFNQASVPKRNKADQVSGDFVAPPREIQGEPPTSFLSERYMPRKIQ
jgi:hypothetical protein